MWLAFYFFFSLFQGFFLLIFKLLLKLMLEKQAHENISFSFSKHGYSGTVQSEMLPSVRILFWTKRIVFKIQIYTSLVL